MLDGGVHFWSALRMIASACGCGDPKQVSAHAREATKDLPQPDSLVGWVGFENGVHASVSVTFAAAVVRVVWVLLLMC